MPKLNTQRVISGFSRTASASSLSSFPKSSSFSQSSAISSASSCTSGSHLTPRRLAMLPVFLSVRAQVFTSALVRALNVRKGHKFSHLDKSMTFGTDMCTLSLMLMFYVKLFMKYGKASLLFSMTAILNIAKNGGSIKISGCFHQKSEIVWHGGHLCQISCFCPDVKIYYIKNPHYMCLGMNSWEIPSYS